jgi:thiamine pyrophosphate-dependent acetolactate synthase large subunit-like protein
VLAPDAVVAGDAAMACYYGYVHFFEQLLPRRFLYPTGYATLGYGLPAAIGAKQAAPEVPTIALMGDGGFMFSAPELVTAVEQRLPLPIVVVNNGGYGEIRREMREQGLEPLAVDLVTPDFVALARACGATGVRVGSAGELGDVVECGLSVRGPTVIELAE